MLAHARSAAVNGIEGFPIELEDNSGWGDVVVNVGLPVAAVKASRNRVVNGFEHSARRPYLKWSLEIYGKT